MIFDPFGDFERNGYLRNKAGLHDPAAIKIFQHAAFLDKLEDALKQLARTRILSYADVLNTHQTLFMSSVQNRKCRSDSALLVQNEFLFEHGHDRNKTWTRSSSRSQPRKQSLTGCAR
jgi:hypothetical protein